jgi:hypothetical protein
LQNPPPVSDGCSRFWHPTDTEFDVTLVRHALREEASKSGWLRANQRGSVPNGS